MMSTDPCPDPETLAEYLAGSVSEQVWRGIVRHLSDCAACRRHVSMLVRTEEARLPAATVAPPLPGVRRVRRSPALRFAAAAAVLGALAWALLELNASFRKTSPPPIAERKPTVEERRETPAPRPEPPTPPAPPREPEPVPAKPAPEPAPNRLPPAEPPREPAPRPADTRLAARSPRGTTEAVEIAAGTGTVTVVSGDSTSALAKKRHVSPSDVLRAESAASFALPDGTTVHLPAGSAVAVSFSQTHLCPAIDVRQGSALVDLGAEPRPVHVSSGPLGVRLGEASGQLLVAAAPESLRATPLGGTARFRSPSGPDRVLGSRETLVLREADDGIEPLADLELAASFPTSQEALPRPAVVPAEKPPRPPVDPRELCFALGRESYRYRVSGRLLREGAWAPEGVFVSSIDDFLAVRRAQDKTPAHFRRGTRDWDNLGTVTKGSREERILDALRVAQAPHAQLAQTLAASRGEPQTTTRQVMDRACVVLDIDLDPARIQGEVHTLMQQAVADGRLQAPDQIVWSTLEGTIELSVAKHDPRILRAVDRRRVAYTHKTRTVNRQWYHLETVYEFSEHGLAALKLPPEMLRELDVRK
jgi:ferric-dicitrate binding protein FerR (iron transport regulator)